MQTMKRVVVVWRAIGVGIATLAMCWGHAASVQAADYVGDQKCIACHGQENLHFGETMHAKVFRLNPGNDRQRQGCEACHGPGSEHEKNATDKAAMIGFTKAWGTPLSVQNAQCMNCHQGGNRLHWPGSIHEASKLGCADCHNPMEKLSANTLLARKSVTETCFQCHQQQRAEFRKRSHMPVPEGKMSCVDCHNPHGTATRPLLKGDTVNDVCYTCHPERRGPFLWEHAPVRENCLNCHQPHGSNHDKLLVTARPYMCQQCHNAGAHPGSFYREGQSAAAALEGGAQSSRVIGRTCVNCHSQIHGSNHPAGARFQR